MLRGLAARCLSHAPGAEWVVEACLAPQLQQACSTSRLGSAVGSGVGTDSSSNTSSSQQPAQRCSRDRTWDASCSAGASQQLQQLPRTSSAAMLPLLPVQLGGGRFSPLRHIHSSSPTSSSSSSSSSSVHHHHQQQRRAYASRPATHPTMPEPLASLIQASAINAAVRPPPPPLEARPLRFESRRAGVIAIKAGMMQDWDEYGARVPLTVLWVDECMVVRHKHRERDGVTSLVLGCGARRAKQLHPRQLGEFQALGLPLKRKLWEVPVTDDALLPTGTPLGASHFVAGQYLDVTGVTKGKGFAGVMKRWGFSGQGASHGNTKHHRAPGSIGGRTDPGRVWKGKKMPGHMGAERVTFKNIWLYKVDPSRNLLYVRGQVPGPAGSHVLLRDAFRWKWAARQAARLPFPTHIGPELPPLAVAKRDGEDPYRVYREDIGYFEANWKE